MNEVKTVKKVISLDKLINNIDNVRLENTFEHLFNSIKNNGLERELLVEKNKDGIFTVIRGNCRLACITELKTACPQEYRRFFENGIACEVITNDIDPMTRARLITDHGEVLGLKSEYEMYRSAKLLFQNGASESQFVEIASSSLQELYPIKNQETLAKLENARKEGTLAYYDMLAEVRRGLSQFYKYTVQGCCVSADYLKAVAENRPHYKVTKGDVGKLWTAFNKDKKVKNANGTPKYSRTNHGENVQAYIDKLIEKDKNKGKTETVSKIMARKDIEALRDMVESVAFTTILTRVLGDMQDNTEVLAIDELLASNELLASKGNK